VTGDARQYVDTGVWIQPDAQFRGRHGERAIERERERRATQLDRIQPEH